MNRIVLEGEHIKLVLEKLEDAKRSVDDLIDTFELLQDEDFINELGTSLSEAEKGEVEEFKNIDELRAMLARE